MKNTIFNLFRILIAIVLIAKILNWFLHFDQQTNRILNMTMFSLIGIAYIVMGNVWDKLFTRIIITGCGVFLLVMNFFNDSTVVNLLGIACILTPMLIARFHKNKNSESDTQPTK